jgi:hypothetical protein
MDKISLVKLLYSDYNNKKKQYVVENPDEYINQILSNNLSMIQYGFTEKVDFSLFLSTHRSSFSELFTYPSLSDEIIKKELTRMNRIICAKTNVLWRQAHNNIKECCYQSCNKKSIASHILQKNGILSRIAENNHLYTMETDFLYSQLASFKKIGINDIFTFRGFCKSHDESIFFPIEKKESVDFDDYTNQLLFAYRTMMSEKRKKEVMIEFHNLQIKSEPLLQYSSELHYSIEGHNQGILDCEFYEKLFLQDIEHKSCNFTFHVAYTSFQEVCISSIFSYETTQEIENYFSKNKKNKDRLAEIFISYFPIKNDCNVLMMGYLNEYKPLCGSWVNDIYSSNESVLLKRISDIMLRLSEQWVCSEFFYENNIKNREKQILNIINETGRLLDERTPVDFNVFLID